MVELEPLIVDLVIVGAGYAGINALNAASHHLQQGARVAIVAKEAAWGGQWVWQYDYVRLHQPYRSFSAGEREWKLQKPWSYLAGKKEILQHFEDIAAACVQEKSLNMIQLFNYEACSHEALAPPHAGSWEGNAVQVLVAPLKSAQLPRLRIIAKLLIEAEGADIQPKPALDFSASDLVHSLRPVDVLTPEWNVRMTVGDCKDKPIWVIGSGKTAMDVMLRLSEFIPGANNRIRCICGRGTWFLNRDVMNVEDWWQKHVPGNNTFLDYMVALWEKWDGSNTQETYRAMAELGFMHSVVPEAESFMIGICSSAEVQAVRTILNPFEEKLVRAHLVDIVADGQDVQLKLQRISDGSSFMLPIASGSVVINCTDHIMPAAQRHHRPILSHSGLVLSPQSICGFTGPSANLCTHLHYKGLLEPLWGKMPRFPAYTIAEKEKFGISGLMFAVLSTAFLVQALPNGQKYQPQRSSLPLYRLILAGLRLRNRMKAVVGKHFKLHHNRFTDEYTPQDQDPDGILCGNVGRPMSRL
mmetsp:Transcript_120279/g.190500  ORF Transcript_120279/g.190500 Transcript_120279/m.190500 type:complete len:527 (-) Transcript_120279:75-1655(-)